MADAPLFEERKGRIWERENLIMCRLSSQSKSPSQSDGIGERVEGRFPPTTTVGVVTAEVVAGDEETAAAASLEDEDANGNPALKEESA